MVPLKESKGRIMLVEDNQNLRNVLKDYLETLKYNVSDFSTGDKAAESFEKGRFDLCLFDIVMHGMNGFDLLAHIRKTDEHVPVVFLTARTEKEDKIRAFKLGCDDYITKPFSTEELTLRIAAILRRTRQPAKVKPVFKATGEIYTFGNFTFDHANLRLSHPLKVRTLTRKEAELLRLLCENINHLVPREEILRKIWGSDDYASGRSMDVFLTKLRSYLAIEPVEEKYINKDKNKRSKYIEGYEPDIEIKNVHGTGFLLKVKGITSKSE
ncbi:MAG: response regulator transcription factor [Bacteroidales bacterium]|nr:response regulator transcription factor [Bacteroidales bacterium]